MKKFLFLAACLLTLVCYSPRAYATPPDVVVVRISEGPGKIALAIARNGQPEELLEFDNGYKSKDVKDTSTFYQKIIQRLYQEGYVLQGTFGSAATAYTTLIFVKGA